MEQIYPTFERFRRWLGASAMLVAESEPSQPDGTVRASANEVLLQPLLSLFFTLMV